MEPWSPLALLLCLFFPIQSRPLQEFLSTQVKDTENTTSDDISNIIESINKGPTRILIQGDIAMKIGRSAISCPSRNCFWSKSSNGLVNVPYKLPAQYTTEDISTFEAAILEFTTLTCIRFVPRTNEVDYLDIISDNGCWSFLGRAGGAQDLSLQRTGCLTHGIIQHELNHALGFEHEHCRSDRDSYIEILWNNIAPDYRISFNKTSTNNLGLAYDYSSVMHYGRYDFSIGYSLPTIQPIPNRFTPIGQRFGLSNLDVAKINKLYDCNLCSSILSEDSGSFTSASHPSYYSNNTTCSWLIRVPFDKVYLQFNNFNVQPSPACTADYIRVFDGAHRTSTVLLDKSCGTGPLPTLVASGNTMLVEFVTDGNVTTAGFRASYHSVKCGGTLMASSGLFSSPGYEQGQLYPPFSDCTWSITAPVGYKVLLNFLNFQLEDSDSCSYDDLTIWDGMTTNSLLKGTYCGIKNNLNVTSSGNTLLLLFHSDSSEEFGGFLANYSFVAAA